MNKHPDPEKIDDENPEWTEEDFKRAKRLDQLPPNLQAKLRAVRGPQKAPTKEQITIQLSPEVVAAFRATGIGWQSRLDAALADWLKDHSPEEVEKF
ncbi:MAG: BrnA antitoxin family protein [Methylohalobius sp. ZOD2]